MKRRVLPNNIVVFCLFISCLWMGLNSTTLAQTANGNASVLGNECFQLTGNNAWEAGSVFFPDTLNLNQPFSFQMNMNFGSQDAGGADGIVFVLQNNSATELGMAGGSLGWFGIQNSVGVEFDTYENIPESDPVEDHIAILRDGIIDHGTAQNLAGPVSAKGSGANIEDGQDHLVQINWNPVNYNLRVYFDCEVRLSTTLDLVNTIFNGDSLVHWGFTGASGGAFNPHSVCLLDLQNGSTDTLEVCPGDAVPLTAGPSQDGIYTWTPGTNLSGTAQRTVTATPDQDITYTVSYRDSCGISTVDTLVLNLASAVSLNLGNDTTLCTGSMLLLNPAIGAGTISWSDGSTSPTLPVNSSGQYSIAVQDTSGCTLRDTIQVDFVDPPVVSTHPDTAICGSEEDLLLIAAPIVPNTIYIWSTGDTATEISVNTTDLYVITAMNGCSTATDTTEIIFFKWEEGYFIPNVFTPNGDGFFDQFVVENFQEEDFHLRIFDRWGRKLFDTFDNEAGWNGTNSGTKIPTGAYYYVIQTRDCLGEVVEDKGVLSLLR